MRFKNKVAFITGGGTGIGEVMARGLSAEGAAVVLADIDLNAAQTAAKLIESKGGRAFAVECDVADETRVEAAVSEAAGEFGGIDILINNAARHLLEYNAPLTELPRNKWREMLDVNVVGIVNCAASCRPFMKARGGGVIVNISSIASLLIDTQFGMTPYGVSKLAVRALVVGLAREFAADNIRVYGIAPGPVESQAILNDESASMLDAFVKGNQLIKRRGQMTDLVGALKFFCSDDASFITGETLVVGGGFPLRI